MRVSHPVLSDKSCFAPVSVHIDHIGGTRQKQYIGLTVGIVAVVICFMGCSIPTMSVIV